MLGQWPEFATATERMGPLVVGGESKKGDMRSILRIHAHQLGCPPPLPLITCTYPSSAITLLLLFQRVCLLGILEHPLLGYIT